MERNEHIVMFFILFNISYFARKFTPILQCCNEVYHGSRIKRTAIPSLACGNLVIWKVFITLDKT
jgi:hypothetical protein